MNLTKDLIKIVKDDLRKNNHNLYFKIYMILSEISEYKNIISFNYKDHYLMVQIGLNDYYRIKL